VPVIAAIEGRAHVHSEYALLANVIVAGEGATFHDVPHFAGGIVPGDGIFTAWSYRPSLRGLLPAKESSSQSSRATNTVRTAMNEEIPPKLGVLRVSLRVMGDLWCHGIRGLGRAAYLYVFGGPSLVLHNCAAASRGMTQV
jgi:hypothetical protein